MVPGHLEFDITNIGFGPATESTRGIEMFGRTFTLFKLFDFTVKIDLSWLIILGLVIWSLAGGVFPGRYPGMHWGVYVAMGLGGAAGLFASIIFHELCHSLVARRFGMPMKGITLFIFGGVAEMGDEPPSPKAEFSMAIAGPLSSLGLAGAFQGMALLGNQLVWPDVLVGVFTWLALINAILVAFNMIPGFPLDGGRVLRSIIWHIKGDLRKATHISARVGAGFGAVLIVLGFVNLLTLNPIGGLWWILIGFFIRSAARQSYQSVLMRQVLGGEHVRRFMTSNPVSVPYSATVQQLVDDYVYVYHHKMFPVVDDDRLVGCISTRQIKDIPRELWSARQLSEVVSTCSPQTTTQPGADAMSALEQMNRTQSSRLLVVQGDKLLGIVTLKDLLRFLSLKLELEVGDKSSVSRPQAMDENMEDDLHGKDAA